jgi:hypothetical protein
MALATLVNLMNRVFVCVQTDDTQAILLPLMVRPNIKHKVGY